MEVRTARAGERDEVLDLLARWYGDRTFFSRYNLNDPAFRDELCLVACEGGKIVSTAQIFDRRVRLQGQTVPMGGIGSVYTHEDWRQRGAAGALIRLALEILDGEGFEVSLLFTDLVEFYERFGWKPVNRTFTALMGAENLVVDGGIEVELFDQERDFDEVREIHDAYSTFDACEVRSDARWRANLKYAGNPDEHFVVARDQSGSVNAYARSILMQGYPIIMEYGYRRGRYDSILSVMTHLGRVVSGIDLANESELHGGNILRAPQALTSGMLVAHTRQDPDFERELQSSGCYLMHHEEHNYMWRLISASRFAGRFNLDPAVAEGRLYALVGSPSALFWTADRF